jgi:hypothetical protein
VLGLISQRRGDTELRGRPDPLTPLEFKALDAVAELSAVLLDVQKGAVELTLGTRRAAKCSRSRIKNTGTAAAKVQERYGTCCLLTEAQTVELQELATELHKFERLPYYANHFGVSEMTISRELTWRRVQDGKKAINVMQVQKAPSNGDMVRMYDMMLGCLAAIMKFTEKHGIEALGYEDESKVLYGLGNWPQHARALAGQKVTGDLPHHPNPITRNLRRSTPPSRRSASSRSM